MNELNYPSLWLERRQQSQPEHLIDTVTINYWSCFYLPLMCGLLCVYFKFCLFIALFFRPSMYVFLCECLYMFFKRVCVWLRVFGICLCRFYWLIIDYMTHYWGGERRGHWSTVYPERACFFFFICPLHFISIIYLSGPNRCLTGCWRALHHTVIACTMSGLNSWEELTTPTHFFLILLCLSVRNMQVCVCVFVFIQCLYTNLNIC